MIFHRHRTLPVEVSKSRNTCKRLSDSLHYTEAFIAPKNIIKMMVIGWLG